MQYDQTLRKHVTKTVPRIYNAYMLFYQRKNPLPEDPERFPDPVRELYFAKSPSALFAIVVALCLCVNVHVDVRISIRVCVCVCVCSFFLLVCFKIISVDLVGFMVFHSL